MSVISRFAPSPTGYLHLGHAYSALLGRAQSDVWRLRLEDIDTTRCRKEYALAIPQDLSWLGLSWNGAIRVQSEHLAEYRKALEVLNQKEVLYPCFCTRGEIARAQSAPHFKETIYPGTCRNLSPVERDRKLQSGLPFALRMNVEQACKIAGHRRFFEIGAGWVDADPCRWGDVIIARKDTPTSYHLCVVHDDWVQEISNVVRGDDLRDATHIHVLLQALLGYETPRYMHHKLLLGSDGKRLAKRHQAVTIREMREAGITPAEVLKRIETT
ncbi:MAG: tRNA glutamyl-Q(34) synthetase GluQRS [Rhodospirillales bacterium]|nr:tRNA glutamyl-Q(34) synthetase GluQRS [Rhodospirillales bacterium]